MDTGCAVLVSRWQTDFWNSAFSRDVRVRSRTYRSDRLVSHPGDPSPDQRFLVDPLFWRRAVSVSRGAQRRAGKSPALCHDSLSGGADGDDGHRGDASITTGNPVSVGRHRESGAVRTFGSHGREGIFKKLSAPVDALALGMYYAGIFCIP